MAASDMQALLGSIVADPDVAVERLSIVDASECNVLLKAFNAMDLAPTDLFHADQTVHGLLEHWARVTPDKPAAIFEARLQACCAVQHAEIQHDISHKLALRSCQQQAIDRLLHALC